VGDILKVEDTHKFAADMVILSTSASTGKFFVMTANLDGETNLKPMSAARLTKHCRVSHTGRKLLLRAVLRIRIRIHWIHMLSGFPDPDPLVSGMDPDPDPSIIVQK
jgi:magnesium-transporting ATPase (P-type)